MTDEEFTTWNTHHARLFMMNTPADIELFIAWKPLVIPYDLQDFIEGSNYLATERSMSFRTTHLDIIRQRIHARLIDESRRRIEAEQGSYGEADCPSCFGSGVVSVPHPQNVHMGQWLPPFARAGVFCHCSLGQAKFASLGRALDEAKDARRQNVRLPAAPLAWAKYEALVPNWAELLDCRARQQRAEIEARQHARHADQVSPLAALLERSIKQVTARVAP